MKTVHNGIEYGLMAAYLEAAMEESVPVPMLSAALFARYSSLGGADFAIRILSAMRRQFGGHEEKKPGAE